MAKRSVVHHILIAAVLESAWLFADCGEISGSYDVMVHQIMRCEDSGNGDIAFSTTRINKISRYTYNYFTNFTTNLTLSDELSLVPDFQAWGNGGWRPGFFTVDVEKFCTDVKILNPYWFNELINNTGKEDCPIPPGNYSITATNISFTQFTLPMLPYGKYRMINQVYNKDVIIGCVGMVVEITPKRKQRRNKNG